MPRGAWICALRTVIVEAQICVKCALQAVRAASRFMAQLSRGPPPKLRHLGAFFCTQFAHHRPRHGFRICAALVRNDEALGVFR
jgi:hypothetical protein